MTDQRSDNEETGSGARRLLDALRGAASDAATRETLRELGERARGVVEELARNARNREEDSRSRTAAAEAASARRTAADSSAGASPVSALPADLHHRLEELRCCVADVADTITATVERLETIESQLGDPGTAVEELLAGGLERCERVLLGIEHRFLRAADREPVQRPGASPARGWQQDAAPERAVLVVAASSRDRAAWCVDLEKSGLCCMAATGLAGALRLAARSRFVAALLVVQDDAAASCALLDDWKEAEEQGTLPPALLVGSAAAAASLRSRAAALGFAFAGNDEGAAATAACLLRLARGGDEPALTNDSTGGMTT